MVLRFLLIFLLLLELAVSEDEDFLFNGFRSADLSLDGAAEITSGRLLRLTTSTKQVIGHAFYHFPIRFKRSPAGKAFSFSTTFAFAIISEYSQLGDGGIAFVISPTANAGSQYLGILSPLTNGNATNYFVAVELDTVYNPEFKDINDNHVGIDVNSLTSVASRSAGYYVNGSNHEFRNLNLISGERMQVWVDYAGDGMRLNVTLGLLGLPKPSIPLLSVNLNLTDIIHEWMQVGFSSSTGYFLTSHYILGWSFRMNGQARPLNITALPVPGKPKKALALWASVGGALLVLVLAVTASGVLIMKRRKTKPATDAAAAEAAAPQEEERWEMDYGPHRFSYRELYAATGGFKEKGLLGTGGFGRVYRGVLPSSKVEVAVKRVSPGSKQGTKEFIAEIVSIGRLRHRNLVQLLGYCRRKKELILVYSYMPNGSLDKLLFGGGGGPGGLSWEQRFQIVKGVASGLLYLHEEWEQVIIHRDIKAGNVLLDGDFNGRLGDFGLARLSDHGNDPHTTHVAGTMGYMAPELTRSGRATKATDVFAFGVFLLEVACGRRPIERQAPEGEVVLLDWALRNWKRDAVGECADPKLAGEYPPEEMELVLKLGLLCSHQLPAARPTIRQVMQYLLGDFPLPDVTASYMDMTLLEMPNNEEMSPRNISSPTCFSTDSLFYGGR